MGYSLLSPTAVTPYLGPIAGRTFIPEESGSSANPTLMAQTHHPLSDNIINGFVRAQWPNWRASAGAGPLGGATEILPGATSTCTASVQYTDPLLGTVIRRMVGYNNGLTTYSAASGANFDMVAPVNALMGSNIYLRFWGSFPGANGMNYSQHQADYSNGDAFNFGAAVADQTGNTTTIPNAFPSNLAIFSPCAVLGMTTRRTFAIVGDSRTTGLFDVPNTSSGFIGNWPRLLAQLPFPPGYVNLAVPGDTAAAFPTNSVLRRQLAANASNTLILQGVNDIIFNGATAAATLAYLQQTVGMIGKPALCGTIDPCVNYPANTVYSPANDPQRVAFNTAMRAASPPTPFLGIFDPASVLETGNSGVWANIAYTGDGTHETNVGNALAASTSGFNFGLLN